MTDEDHTDVPCSALRLVRDSALGNELRQPLEVGVDCAGLPISSDHGLTVPWGLTCHAELSSRIVRRIDHGREVDRRVRLAEEVRDAVGEGIESEQLCSAVRPPVSRQSAYVSAPPLKPCRNTRSTSSVGGSETIAGALLVTPGEGKVDSTSEADEARWEWGRTPATCVATDVS